MYQRKTILCTYIKLPYIYFWTNERPYHVTTFTYLTNNIFCTTERPYDVPKFTYLIILYVPMKEHTMYLHLPTQLHCYCEPMNQKPILFVKTFRSKVLLTIEGFKLNGNNYWVAESPSCFRVEGHYHHTCIELSIKKQIWPFVHLNLYFKCS